MDFSEKTYILEFDFGSVFLGIGKKFNNEELYKEFIMEFEKRKS